MNLYQKLDDYYDVLICGGGPGGLITALHIIEADRSLRVALLDRMDSWKHPVLCAEGVSKNGLHAQVQVDEDWIRSHLDGVDFFAPDNTKVRYTREQCGYIIDRPLMHKRLAERCATAGVHCHFKSFVTSIGEYNGESRTVQVKQGDAIVHIKAKIVVDASGAGNSLDTQEGLASGAFDLETAVFSLVKGVPHDPAYIGLFYHSKHFPNGYGWIFPQDGETANVGLVIGKQFNKEMSPKKRFVNWVQELWPNVELGTIYGGPIPCGQEQKPMAVNHLYKVGDSASSVNPLSRGGIVEAMKCGHAAGECIVKVLQGANALEQEKRYCERWMELHGKGHLRLHAAKKAFGSIPDSVFNKASHRIAKIPVEKRSLFTIFWHTLLSSPILLWRMRSLLR